MRIHVACLAALVALGLVAPGPAAAQRAAPGRLIDSLVARMTLEEKLGQLNLPSVDNQPSPAQLEQVRKGLVGGFLNLAGAQATRDAQRIAVTESRLHIPLLLGLDVIHGYRTIFPIPLAEAATWDPAAAESTARAAAREAAAAGVNWTFAPMVDIARDPRWGRIAEGSGEDPYLGSAVDAGAGSIMTSFNEIGGIPSHANRWLVTTLLRDEWKFPGFVVSDWTGVEELRNHGVAGSRADAGLVALEAGVDMDMVSRIYLEDLPALIRAGRIPMTTVDAAVRRVLAAKRALGLFDDPYRGSSVERERSVLLAPEQRKLARTVAQEAIVLLKNDGNLLPLGPTRHTLAVIGPLADDHVAALGSWAGRGDPRDAVTPLDGIKARAGTGSEVRYAKGCGIVDTATAGFAEAVALARQADVALLILGEAGDMSGEAASRSSLGLPGVQQQLLEAVQATGTPVALILMNGRPLTVQWAADHVPAIVEAWFLGVETGPALAGVLFGDVNPSGKLPVTFPRAVGQIPIYYNHKNTGRPAGADKYTSKHSDLPSR